jgi:hypothetical protein
MDVNTTLNCIRILWQFRFFPAAIIPWTIETSKKKTERHNKFVSAFSKSLRMGPISLLMQQRKLGKKQGDDQEVIIIDKQDL